MKKTLLTLALTVVCIGAFAQGKINMVNDANHYVAYGNNLLPADAALAGTLVTSSSGFLVDLYGYAGTAPGGSFTLQTTVPLNSSIPGGFGPQNFISTLPAGAAATFYVGIRDLAGIYSGVSSTFTMVPSGTIAYNSLVNAGGTSLSTWAAGTTVVPGGFAGISVNVVPEPSSIVLAGLGAASLLMFRRRG